MPKNKIIKKSINDKFYTKPEIVDLCLKELQPYLTNNDFYIEPSCGNGAFLHKLPEPKIGIDIEPDCDALKMSWFDYHPEPNSVIVGNPPFGERNVLTKQFIKHSLSGRMIAFILPQVFKKETMQAIFPNNWTLIKNIDLPDNSFLLNNESYHVPAIFQIWDKNSIYINLRESHIPTFKTNDFIFTTKNNANYFMFGAAPQKIISPNEVLTNNRGYYILVNNPDILSRLKSIDWKKYALSSVSGGVAWFTKKQILNIYGEEYGQK